MKVVEVQDNPGYYLFECPGCLTAHFINTNPKYGGVWEFNKDLENPTVSPSLLVNAGKKNPTAHQCHSFIKNGKIQFLSDCSHHLAGQTVELPDIE